jgi:DMSO/TMAO reductase YedYZ heme-binding membrane subunit
MLNSGKEAQDAMKTPVILKNTLLEWFLAVMAGGGGVFALMAAMRAGGRPYSLYLFSKAAALAAVTLVLCAIALGSLYRLTTWAWPVRYRRPFGILAGFLVVVHAYLSFFVLSERYDWRYYTHNWQSLLYGFVALAGFLLLLFTSYGFAYRRMGAVAWKRLQNTVYGLLALALLHVCHCGKAVCWLAWLQHQQSEDCARSAAMPPLSFILFLGLVLVIAIRLLEPLFWKDEPPISGDLSQTP